MSELLVKFNSDKAVMKATCNHSGTVYTVTPFIEFPLPAYIEYDDLGNEEEYLSFKLEVIANEGVQIKTVEYYDGLGNSVPFEVNFDKTIATYANYNQYTISGNLLEVFMEYEGGEPPIHEVAGFNHLYLVDKSIIHDLTNEIYGKGTVDDSLEKYMLNVIELPFEINTDIIGEEKKIVLGKLEYKTVASELKNDDMILNLGVVNVPEKYSNTYDYVDTEIFIHLPFTNTIRLDATYVIGCQISIEYVVNLYNGSTTLIIKSSKLGGDVVFNDSFNIGRNIPMVNRINGDIVNQTTVDSIYNNLYKAYIEVVRNVPYNKGIFEEETTINGTLVNELGFIKVNNIDLKTSATYRERNAIKSILESGVIIRENKSND